MVPFGLTTSILAVCPFDTHTMPLTSIGGRSSTGIRYSHCTLSQLPPPKEPEYLTSIIMPVRMTVKPFALYRVTESYEAAIQHPCNEIHRPVDAVPLSVITPVLLTAM